MKAQFFASLLLAGAATAVQAEDLPAKQQVALTGEGQAVKQVSIDAGAEQFKTFGAGNQMLIDISAEVGDSLDARLEREVGGEFAFQPRPKELLVRGN